MTDARRIETPPGSVLVLRLNELPLDVDDVEPMAAELHRQTGLPVLITDGTADVDVSTREQAVTALAQALDDDALEGAEAGVPLAEAVLDLLSSEGWELVKLR